MKLTEVAGSELKLPKRHSKFGVGKHIGGCIYVHKQYEDKLPFRLLQDAKELAREHAQGYKYNLIKYCPKEQAITFIHSPDFNSAHEPTMGDAVLVKDGKVRQIAAPNDPWIYHHKWLFVGDDYEGFDVEESKNRSRQWMELPDVDYARIGKKSHWDTHIQPRLGDKNRGKRMFEAMSPNYLMDNTTEDDPELRHQDLYDVFLEIEELELPQQEGSSIEKMFDEYDRIYVQLDELLDRNPNANTSRITKRLDQQLDTIEKVLAPYVEVIKQKHRDDRRTGVAKRRMSEQYSEDEVLQATRTSRAGGAVGARAITPRYVAETSSKDEKILDYGAGKSAMHAQMLRDQGLNVTAYDFGANVTEVHDPKALNKKYDTVYASNVLNVQSSEEMLDRTLYEISDVVKKRGRFVANYPVSPRFMDMDTDSLMDKLSEYFSTVERVGGTKSAPILEAKK